jgi:DNA polymerase-3 subunit beta
MKFIVSSSILSSHLQVIGRVVTSKNVIPILDCFLFELSKNQLTITGADTETRIITSIEVQDTDGSGVFAIPSKNLLDSLKELPDQPVTFDINDETLELVVFYENGKYNFVAERGDEYPHPKPLSDDATRITIPAEQLLTSIGRTLFATGEDELRPVMNGIYFDISDDDITFVASDGHKLVRFKNLSTKGNGQTSFILPKKPANLLRTVLPKETGTVSISFDANNAYFKLGKIEIITRLIEGTYPAYNMVIPKENPYKIVVDRLQFTNALKRVTVFANPTSSLIKLSISPNTILISTQDFDYSTSAEEEVACVYDGEPLNIGFKGVFLIEVLNNAPSSEVILELGDPARAGLILPSENEEDEDLLMLLMPMMLNE